ncbi:hypothetical protein [Tenacibaculum soleae]|uniref:hypothetical protein n=1 Tax=Tenacibaculum soleae TaxID=447689 RepID=UPI0023011CE9|nr:hypothetical protein [Tenacibaculum soleae]
MKKFVSIITLAIVSIVFTSCTDLTEDLEQENEKKVTNFIDKDKVETPTTKG